MTDTLTILEQHRWDVCKVNANKGPQFKAVADRLMAPDAMARYKTVSGKTGVPWQVIAVIHEREASQNWNTQLGQGDPLNKKSVHKPKGRGPFKTWEDGAIDALTNCAPFASKNKDWSPGGTLALLEEYNGLGYANKGVPSPYLWAGTDQYVKGKYTSDGVYSPNVVDQQLGCAGLLKFMGAFKTGVGASTGAAGAVIVAGGTAMAATPQHHWPWIIAGTIAAALIAYIAFEVYEYNKKVV